MTMSYESKEYWKKEILKLKEAPKKEDKLYHKYLSLYCYGDYDFLTEIHNRKYIRYRREDPKFEKKVVKRGWCKSSYDKYRKYKILLGRGHMNIPKSQIKAYQKLSIDIQKEITLKIKNVEKQLGLSEEKAAISVVVGELAALQISIKSIFETIETRDCINDDANKGIIH